MRRFIPAALLAAALAAAACQSPAEGQERMTPVRVVTVTPSVITEDVFAPARLEGVDEALIYPAMGGRVEEVLVSEGDSVTAGTPLVRLATDRQVNAGTSAAAAGVTAARTAEQNALRSLERMQSLFEAGAISQQELETAEAMYQGARAALEQANAGAQQARSLADNSLVTAPFDGRIGRIWVRPGNTAGGGPVISISNGSSLVASVLLPETNVTLMEPGLPAHVRVLAYDGEVFPGQVTAAARSVDPMSGLVPVEVTFGNPDGRLLPGMSGTVGISLRTVENAVVLPEIAFRRSAGGFEVVLERDGAASVVPVTTGISNQGLVEVLEGVEPGDRVIVEGQFRVVDGEPVRVVE